MTVNSRITWPQHGDARYPPTRGDGGYPNPVVSLAFTVNTTDEDPEVLSKALEDLRAMIAAGCIKAMVVAEEEGGETNRRHLQGFAILAEKKRCVFFGNRVRGSYVTPRYEHSTDAAAWDYCAGVNPDGTPKDGFLSIALQHGDRPSKGSGQGRRSDLRECNDRIADGEITSFDQLNDEYPTIAARHRAWANYRLDRARREAMAQVPRYATPYDERVWQHMIKVMVAETAPDDRTINIIRDEIGGAGKSRLSYELSRDLPFKIVQVLKVGRKADMAEALNPSVDVLIIDIPRSRCEHVDHVWSFLEEVKDGAVFAPKYESEMKLLGPVHVFIFQNHEVDTGGAVLKQGLAGYRAGHRASAARLRSDRLAVAVRNNPTMEETVDVGEIHRRAQQAQLEAYEYKEPPLTYDRYRILELNERLRTPMSEGGAEVRCGRWKVYTDPKFTVGATFGPLEAFVDPRGHWLPGFGPEYSSDNAGDGPLSTGDAALLAVIMRNARDHWPGLPEETLPVIDLYVDRGRGFPWVAEEFDVRPIVITGNLDPVSDDWFFNRLPNGDTSRMVHDSMLAYDRVVEESNPGEDWASIFDHLSYGDAFLEETAGYELADSEGMIRIPMSRYDSSMPPDFTIVNVNVGLTTYDDLLGGSNEDMYNDLTSFIWETRASLGVAVSRASFGLVRFIGVDHDAPSTRTMPIGSGISVEIREHDIAPAA